MTKVIHEINQEVYSEDTCFIPTMGSLHKGHTTLFEQAKATPHAKIIVSIFVNRKQFNDKKDFDNYPIDIDNDIKLLEKVNVDYIFIPDESYIYPNKNINNFISFNGNDSYVEIPCSRALRNLTSRSHTISVLVRANQQEDKVPIWLGFTSMLFADFSLIPFSRRFVFVTNKSSPTI